MMAGEPRPRRRGRKMADRTRRGRSRTKLFSEPPGLEFFCCSRSGGRIGKLRTLADNFPRSAGAASGRIAMDEETAIVGILLAGALATVVGVLMWQGVWAGLAALGFPAALFAMTREQRR